MSWVRLLIGATDLAVSVNNARKFEELKSQGAATAMVEALVTALRAEVFKYKQAVDSILELEEQNLKVAAGAMRLLEERLADSGITPDLFSSFDDKEYTAATTKLIRTHSQRLTNMLPPDDQAEVEQLIARATPVDDYEYYLAHYEEGKKLQVVEEYGPRNSCLPRIMVGLYIYPGSGIALLLFGGIGGVAGEVGQVVGIALGVIVWIFGMYRISRWMSAKKYREAKKLVDEIESDINLQRFNRLDTQFNGNKAEVERKYQAAQRAIKDFFGEAQYMLQ
jgi:hypothetical protein